MSPIQRNKSQSRSSTGSLSRANSTGAAAALRRGELKISDPIPIPREGVDGFGPQAGVGSPDFQSTTSLRNPKVQSERASAYRSEASPNPLSSSPSVKHKSVNESQHSPVPIHHPHDSISSIPSKSSVKKKRKDSTLKTVMRKIFGSKREQPRTSGVVDHHRSTQSADLNQDLNRLGHSAHIAGGKTRLPRSSSVPISEVTRASALGSHSPFAPNFDFATDEPPRDGSPEEPRRQRRRATLPSIVLTPDELRQIAASLGQTASRPERGNAQLEGYDYGLSPGTSNPKRRSRSAGRYEDAPREHQMSPIQWRRRRSRSDEIKYWRTSVLDQPIPNIMASRIDRPEIEGSNPVEESQPEYPAPPDTDKQDTPFDFGPLIGSIQNTESATLEQRMTTLEVKVIDLEYAISKLQGRGTSVFQPVVLGEPPKRRDQTAAPGSSRSSQRYQTMGRPPEASAETRLKTQVPPTFLASPTRSIAMDDDRARPTSEVNTLRPQTALHRTPTPSEPVQPQETSSIMTSAHFDQLVSLIKYEEAARKKLELQVLQLQRQVHKLQSTQITPGGYPTPSPESQGPPVPRAPSRRRHAHIASLTSPRTETEGEDSDTDDGFMDVYETPAEAQDHKYSIEYNTRQQMAGMI